jgi:hypothetical protein
MMEGDEDKALALEEQIENEIRRQAEESAVRRIAEDNAKRMQTQAAAEFQTAVKETLADYPMLDAKAAQPNRIAIAAVVQIRNEQMQLGKSPAEALRIAAEEVAAEMGLQKAGAAAPAAAAADDGKKVDQQQARKQQILRRNAQAARAQPADIGTVGAGRGARGAPGSESDINVRDLTEEEFEALPAAERKRLRGD